MANASLILPIHEELEQVSINSESNENFWLMAMSNNSLAVDAAEAAGQAVEKTCAFCSAPASKRCSQCHQAYCKSSGYHA